jgi:hypothetical protein
MLNSAVLHASHLWSLSRFAAFSLSLLSFVCATINTSGSPSLLLLLPPRLAGVDRCPPISAPKAGSEGSILTDEIANQGGKKEQGHLSHKYVRAITKGNFLGLYAESQPGKPNQNALK